MSLSTIDGFAVKAPHLPQHEGLSRPDCGRYERMASILTLVFIERAALCSRTIAPRKWRGWAVYAKAPIARNVRKLSRLVNSA